jgi:hypothetical protein
LKHFKEYLKEATGHVTFTFGRFNPPTVGHEKLIEKVHSLSKGTYRIYASQSHDAKKNPLDYTTKIKFMRKMFPRHARSIIADVKIKTAFDALDSLYAQGYRQVTFVVGSDRVEEFNKTLNKYNGEKRATGFYNFEGGIQVVSAGERDPDAEDVSGMSASKMRAAAGDNNFELFAKGLPSGFKEAQKLFNAVRAGMGLKESYNFRQHIQLPTLSKEREAYVNGDLFKVGDVIEIKESKELGQIQRLGSNCVIIETYNGNKQRKWLKDVIKVEEAVINEMLSKTNWAEYTSINKTKIKSFNDLSTSNGKLK